MPNRLAALPLAAALLLGACGGPTIYYEEQRINYSPLEVSAALGSGLLVEAEGALPNGGPGGAALAAAVADTLDRRGPPWFRGDYTSEAGDGPPRRYRLRWLFGQAKAANDPGLCGRYGSSGPQSASLTQGDAALSSLGSVFAAFCLGTQPLSVVGGEPGAPLVVGTPEFDRFISQMAVVLLPRRSPLDNENEGACFFPTC